MKTKILQLILFTVLLGFSAIAQNENTDKYIESEVVSLAGKKGIEWKSKAGDFLFKPYVLVQTRANMNYYDNEGLSLAEQDNILNSGFSVPYGLIGFAGKAFDKVTFNLAINAASSGAKILNQAWFDVNFKDELRLRVGKFKTPFNQAYLVRLGQTLFPTLPMSLSSRVNLPFDINSVNPTMSTGFDIGVQLHGLIKEKWEYRLGIFNGTGIGTNKATNSLSDDFGVPSLLYSGRLAWMPMGQIPLHQGDPGDLTSTYFMLAGSASYNVEANSESSNDLRTGLEMTYIKNKWYFSAEAYLMNVKFVERQKVKPSYLFGGGYVQAGYFVSERVQPAVRVDLFDRNSTKKDGFLWAPAVGVNYFLIGHNIKLQTMYQYMGKSGHESKFAANDDDNGLPEHMVVAQFQFSF